MSYAHKVFCFGFVLILLTFTGCQTPPTEEELLSSLLSANPQAGLDALEAIAQLNNPAFIPVLIDVYWADLAGINSWQDETASIQALETLSGQTFGDDWEAWIRWYSLEQIPPPAGYVTWKGDLLAKLDPNFTRFFDGPIAERFEPAEIVWGGVAVDGIPALDFVEQVEVGSDRAYAYDEPIFGISINGDSRAYPLRIMDWHEMANDVVGGVPVSIAYCTLCGAAIAFDGRVAEGTVYDFGSSGLLYRSNKLMYDRQTNSLWNQLTGEPVMGPAVGKIERLELLPIVITTLDRWQEQHPNTTILSLDTGFVREYRSGVVYGEYFYSDETLFPVAAKNDALEDKTQIYALNLDGIPKAYPIDTLIEAQIVHDQIGATDLVLIAAPKDVKVDGYSYAIEFITYSAGAEIRAYERGEETFTLESETGELRDEAGSVWKISEEALIGPAGETLARIPGHVAYWFGWQAYYPESEVFRN